MKIKLLAAVLFTVTALTVAIYPMAKTYHTEAIVKPPVFDDQSQQTKKQKIEVVFVLDTTGSMSGLINAAKEKIWSIATTMSSAKPAPEIEIGLVAYRDRGDAYVTKVLDLSSDLDSMYASLMDFKASGGGDTPESVNQALNEAVTSMSWSQNEDSYKVIFLVGDAPPHMDYQDDVSYTDSLILAKKNGIEVNTIQSGNSTETMLQWQQIASLSGGRYFQVEQGGNAIAIATPYDNKIANLSKELDETRLYYGSDEKKQKQEKKVAAGKKLHESSSVASRARRAVFNSSKSGKSNFLGEGELVEEVASGKVKLDDINEKHLPQSLQALNKNEQRSIIKSKAAKRKSLQDELTVLAKERKEYLNAQVAKQSDKKDSLDYQIFDAVKEQAAKKGLVYEDSAPAL